MKLVITILFILATGLAKAQSSSDIAIILNGEKKYTCKDKKNYNYYNSLAIENGCVFQGELKNCQPWNGKSYCYDTIGLLNSMEVYKNGEYVGNGVVDFESAPETDTINQKDSEGRKQGYWKIYGEMRNLPDYKPDQVIEEGYYRSRRKIGIWKKYWPNGHRKSEIEFKNGRASGSFITYYTSGGIEEKGNWKGRFYTKEYERYYLSGCLQQKNFITDSNETITYYLDNCILSISVKGAIDTTESYPLNNDKYEFHTGGHYNKPLKFKSDYTNYYYFKPKHNYCDTCTSLIVGNEDTKYIFKLPPKQYVSDGYHKLYTSDGNILFDGEFKDGNLYDGKYFIYDEFGLLDYIEVYKDGKFAGHGVIGSKDKY